MYLEIKQKLETLKKMIIEYKLERLKEMILEYRLETLQNSKPITKEQQ